MVYSKLEEEKDNKTMNIRTGQNIKHTYIYDDIICYS